MKIKTLAIAAAALLISSPAFATNLARCENLAPLVTPNAPIVSSTVKSSNANFHTSGGANCKFAPAGIKACPDVGPGGSLSTPVAPAEIIRVVTQVPDTITPQYREGELDKRDYAKAVAKELIDAIKEWRQPRPVAEGPFIDWDAPQAGSCS